MRNSFFNDRKWSIGSVFTSQRVLWDLFLVLGVFTATSCLTLHRAGLNEFNTPISIEYAEGNRLALLFFCSSLSLTIVTGLLYRCFGQWIAALLSLMVLLFLVTVVASMPHSIIHFYAFYGTLFGAFLAPLCVLWKQKSWVRLLGLNTVLFSAIMFFYWAGTKNLDIAGFGIVQRAGFMIAWLFNLYVLNDCRNILKA